MRNRVLQATGVIALLLLASCAGRGPVPLQIATYVEEDDPSNPYLNAKEVRDKIAGFTHLSVMPIHGPQVEYIAPDGTNYLWYPGNKVVLKGHWKVEANSKNIVENRQAEATAYRIPAICYQYGSNTYNPATKKSGGKWSCQAYIMSKQFDKGSKKGDIFGLAKSPTPPYVLTKDEAAIAKLEAQLDKSQW